MSRFLFVTWDGAGNLEATLGIARRLSQQGHDVRLLGHRSIEERRGNHGWRFHPFEHTADFDSTIPFDLDAEMSMLTEQLWFSESVARDVREELEREAADVLVVDCMLIGALCAGEAAGIPTVALFHAPFVIFRGGPLVDMMSPALPGLNAIRTDLGLSPVDSIADVHDACALSLVAAPSEFEPEIPLPPNVRFIGPVLDAPPLMRRADELHVDDGPEPLIVVALSTGHQGQSELLQRLVDALGAVRARVVVTTGAAVEPRTIAASDNTRIVQFVPHNRLFPHASLVVTHAGLGTVLTALSHGVPMLCVPIGRDQFFNAARVEAVGAGHTIPADADTKAIGEMVQLTLEDQFARANAKQMATVIAAYDGATDAGTELQLLAQSSLHRLQP
jgi:UDP:flavonoid glycosyltransferase YjiC (YdhE family)